MINEILLLSLNWKLEFRPLNILFAFLISLFLIILIPWNILGHLILVSEWSFLFALKFTAIFCFRFFILSVNTAVKHFLIMRIFIGFIIIFLLDLIPFFCNMDISLWIQLIYFLLHILCKFFLLSGDLAMINSCSVYLIFVSWFLAKELIEAHSIIKIFERTHLSISNMFTFHFSPGILN